jgi:uncharacterized membrane protein (UPF0127 family)/CheY-like chemotaxis protein
VRAVALTLRREDGRIVCESVLVADTIFRRMRGLLGRKSLPSGEGILLRPAWSIHTAFMRFPIDVVFIDPEQVVIRIEHALRPFKTASCRGAREIVELTAGECERRQLEVGDRVAWASLSSLEEGLSSENALARLEHRAEIVLASDDQRFVKLTRFLLDGRGYGIAAQVRPGEIQTALEEGGDALLLDAGNGLADALRLSNAIRAGWPDLPIVIVGEDAATRSPESAVVYDKWEQMDDAIDALEASLGKGGSQR